MPVVRPLASLSVVLFPEVVCVAVVRPLASRKVTFPLEELVALPVVRPEASRYVVDAPEVRAVADVLPEASLTVAFFDTIFSSSPANAATGRTRTRTKNHFIRKRRLISISLLQKG